MLRQTGRISFGTALDEIERVAVNETDSGRASYGQSLTRMESYKIQAGDLGNVVSLPPGVIAGFRIDRAVMRDGLADHGVGPDP